MPKSSKPHLIERGKLRSGKASLGNFTIFVLLVVTQPIDFRRWESKCIPKGESPSKYLCPCSLPRTHRPPSAGLQPHMPHQQYLLFLARFWGGEKKKQFWHPSRMKAQGKCLLVREKKSTSKSAEDSRVSPARVQEPYSCSWFREERKTTLAIHHCA